MCSRRDELMLLPVDVLDWLPAGNRSKSGPVPPLTRKDDAVATLEASAADDTLLQFASLMAQVGATSFALMFAAIHVRWHEWSGTRQGKLSATTALLELLTITLVATSYYSQVPGAWQIVATLCWLFGYGLTTMHWREARIQRQVGYLPTPADTFQIGFVSFPYISYGVLELSALATLHTPQWMKHRVQPDNVLRMAPRAVREALGLERHWHYWLTGALLWFLISGLAEVFVTLSPSLLDAEPQHQRELERIPGPSRPFSIAARFDPPSDSPLRCGIVLLPEVWGLGPDTLSLADRLAGRGHQVLVPDYYDGRRTARKLMKVFLKPDQYAADYARIAQESRSWFEQKGSGRGTVVVGLSIGGTAALADLSGWDAVVAFYPERPQNPRTEAAAPPTLLLYGDKDKKAVKRDIPRIAEKLGPRVLVVPPFASAKHSFMGTGRSVPLWLRPFTWAVAGPNAIAADEAWTTMIDFVDKHARIPEPQADEAPTPPAHTHLTVFQRLKAWWTVS